MLTRQIYLTIIPPKIIQFLWSVASTSDISLSNFSCWCNKLFLSQIGTKTVWVYVWAVLGVYCELILPFSFIETQNILSISTLAAPEVLCG